MAFKKCTAIFILSLLFGSSVWATPTGSTDNSPAALHNNALETQNLNELPTHPPTVARPKTNRMAKKTSVDAGLETRKGGGGRGGGGRRKRGGGGGKKGGRRKGKGKGKKGGKKPKRGLGGGGGDNGGGDSN